MITWTGAADTVWANGANWVGGVPAGTNDTAIINNTSNQPYIATLTQVTLKRLEVNVGASVRVGPSGILTVQNTSGPAVHNRGTIMTAGFFQHTSIGGGGLVNYFGAVVEVQPGGTLSFAEVSVVCFQNRNGATLINNGTISFNTVDQPFSGTGLISGGGTFQSTLVNGTSTFSPGTSPGKRTFDAGLTLIDSGGYLCEIFGPSSFDTICGTVLTFGGTLTVVLDGYTPSEGETFKIATCDDCGGSFDSLSLPPLGGGLEWHVGIGPETVMLAVVPATSVIWEGSTDMDWNTASNWKGGLLPGPASDVIIAPAQNPSVIEAGDNISIGNLEILPCAEFAVEFNATLDVN